jgi:hypothetical protein
VRRVAEGGTGLNRDTLEEIPVSLAFLYYSLSNHEASLFVRRRVH